MTIVFEANLTTKKNMPNNSDGGNAVDDTGIPKLK
ncbi:MAG: hypothetical protein ACI8RD_012387 [Bacillariaceae sp.]